MPFLVRKLRLERRFKRLIALATVVVCALLVVGTRGGQRSARFVAEQAQRAEHWMLGMPPDRAEIQAGLNARRAETAERTLRSLTDYHRGAEPAMQNLFRVAKMDPEHCVIGTGRVNDGFLLSADIFSAATNGRSYRLLPNRRAVWLRQITLKGGVFGLFLVQDTPEVRAAAAGIGAIVDEPSAQTTNSWGLRGPEPDPNARVRGLVLGDSFMQGMFNGDHDTPPLALQRELTRHWGDGVSIVNGGHIGYAPEQYFHTLKEYGERFRPHFVVVSVCPNDFGNGNEVMAGRGDDWDEAAYWLGEIVSWCRSHTIPCLLVPVPCDTQIVNVRKDSRYPAPISDLFQGSGLFYCDALDQFVDEHLRLRREAEKQGGTRAMCVLYNLQISDNHFSPLGAELWARIVAHRLDLLMTPPPLSTRPMAPASAGG
jgi:hypothetical protein